MEAERWRQPASLLGFPTSIIITATIIIITIIIIKDLDSKGDHISKKGQVIINTTQHLPSAVQPQRPLLMFSQAHREGESFPSLSSCSRETTRQRGETGYKRLSYGLSCLNTEKKRAQGANCTVLTWFHAFSPRSPTHGWL